MFVSIRSIFNIWVRRAKTYEQRDRSFAMFSPIALVILPGVWVALVIIGFTGIHWALGVDPLREAFYLSGSSLLTLGFEPAPSFATHVAAFVEATLGLGLIALLISYLPSIYSAFQRRELQVARLATRAGEPASAMAMIRRHHALAPTRRARRPVGRLGDAGSPTSRRRTRRSPRWSSSVRSATRDRGSRPPASCSTLPRFASFDAASCRRTRRRNCASGRATSALRRIADYFGIPNDHDPRPDDPISIDRSEFDAAYDETGVVRCASCVPTVRRAGSDYRGWRVNYDTVLLALGGARRSRRTRPWVSDRSLPYRRPPLSRRGNRR